MFMPAESGEHVPAFSHTEEVCLPRPRKKVLANPRGSPTRRPSLTVLLGFSFVFLLIGVSLTQGNFCVLHGQK